MGLYTTMRVLTILGTRPEAIKLAPILHALDRRRTRVESIVAVTGQHRQMLDQVLTLFRIVPDIDLALMQANQGVGDFAAHAFAGVNTVLDQVKPDVVIVQGDTTTAAVAAQAAFYRRVPVGHVEAGLRTGDPANPFPEEINRRLIDVLARHLFAPTPAAAATLRREGHPRASVHMTGNTVVDALHAIVRQAGVRRAQARPRQPLIVVTSHRREHFGEPLRRICQSLIAIVRRRPDVRIVFPVHLNPNVRAVTAELLAGQARIELIEPLPYDAFIRLLAGASLAITDSGGIQEEAPALGVPVVVIRDTTERMEAVRAGAARLAGTTVRRIVSTVLSELEPRRRRVRNVFGDGHAAERIVRILVAEHGRAARSGRKGR